ncbi:MAG: hypothetical protein U0271_37870 [Polyangiaceae bacterium]
MMLAEALTHLGLARGATPRDARRAHERLRRKLDPESDVAALEQLEIAYRRVCRAMDRSSPAAAARERGRALRKQLERATAALSPAGPPMDEAISVLLELATDPKTEKPALRLYSVVRRYVLVVGEEVLSPETLVSWQLTEELWTNRGAIPDPIRAAIARAIRARRVEVAKDELLAWTAAEPVRAEEVLAQLRRDAPRLARAFGGWLERPRKPGIHSAWKFSWVAVALFVVRFFVRHRSCTNPDYTEELDKPGFRPPISMIPEAPQNPSRGGDRSAIDLAEAAANLGYAGLAADARGIDYALGAHNCALARRRYLSVYGASLDLPPKDARVLEPGISAVRAALDELCPAPR